MTHRQAIYFAPAADSDLHRFASTWLGRDAYTDTPLEQPTVRGVAPERLRALTASPRRYGFHATLKAPFRLRDDTTVDLLHQAVRAFAASRPAFAIAIEVTSLRGFLAFTAKPPTDRLDAFAAACVRSFEPFRAPLDDKELARRQPELRTERQRKHLALWGYPYVMEDFTFHMTLTERLAGEEHDRLLAELRERTAELVRTPLAIDRLAVFEETAPASPFRLTANYPLARP
ncbi:MAG: DUF1045 domain-containing protein [Pseudomonadota bacterium]